MKRFILVLLWLLLVIVLSVLFIFCASMTGFYCPSRAIRTVGSYCAPCDTLEALWHADDCLKCPEREYKLVLKSGREPGYVQKCILKNCPAHSIRNFYGDCVPCRDYTIIETTKEECLKCPKQGFNAFEVRAFPAIILENPEYKRHDVSELGFCYGSYWVEHPEAGYKVEYLEKQ